MTPLDDLQQIYMTGLQEKIQQLETALKEKSPLKLIEVFHKLAGSGKTYGFPEISTIGFEAEKRLHAQFNPDDVKKYITDLIQIHSKYTNSKAA